MNLTHNAHQQVHGIRELTCLSKDELCKNNLYRITVHPMRFLVIRNDSARAPSSTNALPLKYLVVEAHRCAPLELYAVYHWIK